MSRGIRNNNPLNIRHSAEKWQGQRTQQTDKAFVQFVSADWGYRAAIKTLRTYKKKYGLSTLRAVIGRWAPPNQNNTEAYVSAVSKRAKIQPDVPLNLDNQDVCCRLLEAMCFVENGQPGDMQAIVAGVHLAAR